MMADIMQQVEVTTQAQNADNNESITEPLLQNLKDVDNSQVDEKYSYITRAEFTSEIYKIEIGNLPAHLGFVVSRLI